MTEIFEERMERTKSVQRWVNHPTDLQYASLDVLRWLLTDEAVSLVKDYLQIHLDRFEYIRNDTLDDKLKSFIDEYLDKEATRTQKKIDNMDDWYFREIKRQISIWEVMPKSWKDPRFAQKKLRV